MSDRVKYLAEEAAKLTPEEQAELMDALAAQAPFPPYQLTPEQRGSVQRGKEEARRREFVSEEAISAFYRRHWL
jgi:Spy/CpxP family protein refolding chaperone